MNSPTTASISTASQRAAHVAAAGLAGVSISEWYAAVWDAAAGLSRLPAGIAAAPRPTLDDIPGGSATVSVRLSDAQRYAHAAAAADALLTPSRWRALVADAAAGVSDAAAQLRRVAPKK